MLLEDPKAVSRQQLEGLLRSSYALIVAKLPAKKHRALSGEAPLGRGSSKPSAKKTAKKAAKGQRKKTNEKRGRAASKKRRR